MTGDSSEPDHVALSPTVGKVLDEYVAALKADEYLDDEMTERLEALLRKGKVPKAEDLDSALFPPGDGKKP